MLYKTECTDANRHTSEYIAEELEKVIQEIGSEKVMGVVTDSAAAMEKARRLISSKYEYICGYPCVSHKLNLLVGDVMKINSLKNVEGSCKEIIKEINGSHINLATFNKIQIEKNNSVSVLKLPVKTRWGSILASIESLISCKCFLKLLMVTEEINISKNVKRNVLDDDAFWVRLEKIVLILKPIVKWTTLLEGDNFKISQVSIAFIEIEDCFKKYVPELPVSKAEEKQLMDIFEDRKKSSLKAIHFAANLLDPTYHGQSLSKEQHVNAMEFIHNTLDKHPAFSNKKEIISTELINYCAKADMWSMEYTWTSVANVDPISWWNGICQKTELKHLAVSILGLPPSSGATERSFSTYGLIHNKKRNKLTVKRAGMITYVSHNLKLLEPQVQTSSGFRLHSHLDSHIPSPAPAQSTTMESESDESTSNFSINSLDIGEENSDEEV